MGALLYRLQFRRERLIAAFAEQNLRSPLITAESHIDGFCHRCDPFAEKGLEFADRGHQPPASLRGRWPASTSSCQDKTRYGCFASPTVMTTSEEVRRPLSNRSDVKTRKDLLCAIVALVFVEPSAAAT